VRRRREIDGEEKRERAQVFSNLERERKEEKNEIFLAPKQLNTPLTRNYQNTLCLKRVKYDLARI
jgi:hypothetical protein